MSAIDQQRHGRRITAVIPTYNRASTLERALDSVLDQSHRADEVIVADDGSTDATSAILEGYADRVKILTLTNSGAAVARNIGVAHAGGDWIAFLDSDDFWLPGHLERITTAINATSGRAGVYFDDTCRPADGVDDASLWELADFSIDNPHLLLDDATAWVVRRRQPTMLQSSVFARDAWDQVGGLWPKLRSRHDTHIFLRLGIGRPMCAVAGFGCQMTDDDTTGMRQMDAMGTRSRLYWDHTVWLYDDILDRHGDQLSPTDRSTLARRLARGHMGLARHDLKQAKPTGLVHLARAGKADFATLLAPVRRRLTRSTP